jgi:hypothetical protein
MTLDYLEGGVKSLSRCRTPSSSLWKQRNERQPSHTTPTCHAMGSFSHVF